MLSELINLAKNQLGNTVTQNTPLEASQAEQAIEIGGNSIFDGLKGELLSGNLPQLMSLFSGNLDANSLMSNPIVANIARNFIGEAVVKLGISQETANTVVNFALPHLLSFFGSQAKQNPQTLISAVTEQAGDNAMNDIKDMLGGFFK
ncbi:MAG: hypothetical protein U0354_11270 [Candidatus Sericytochromatia bacterium]